MTPSSQIPLRRVLGLVGTHLLLSLAAVVVLVLDRNDASVATTDAWVHGLIVAGTAVLLFAFAARALGGGVGGYRRLRISSAVLLVALVAIVAIPGAFPEWMRILEAVSAACLGAVVVIINRRSLRVAFDG